MKGFVIPRFLVHAMREANIQHEVNPVVGYMSSLLLGAVGTGLAMVFSYTLPLAEEHTALAAGAGLARRRSGPASHADDAPEGDHAGARLPAPGERDLPVRPVAAEAMPFLVEVGVLLDLFTGVFVMGIIIHHISREFTSISTEHLSELKE